MREHCNSGAWLIDFKALYELKISRFCLPDTSQKPSTDLKVSQLLRPQVWIPCILSMPELKFTQDTGSNSARQQSRLGTGQHKETQQALAYAEVCCTGTTPPQEAPATLNLVVVCSGADVIFKACTHIMGNTG